jgi:methionine synthase II (cobalamin-independent)
MENKLMELREKRKQKYRDYLKEKTTSWKKKLRKIELDIIDGRIKREKLLRQFQ